MDSFEPYTIRCVTCSAQLRVERKDAIGKILSCPKCESMVQIRPPDIQSGSETEMEPPQTSEETSAPAKTPIGSDREAFTTDLIIDAVAAPSHKLPQWILLPLAALAGILVTIGIWSVTRQNREQEPTQLPAETNSHAIEMQQTSENLSVDNETNETEEKGAVAASSVTTEATPIAEPGNPSDNNPAPPEFVKKDPLNPNEAEGLEGKNPLRKNPQIAQEQQTPEPESNTRKIVIESNARLPLPPPAPGVHKKMGTNLQGIQLKETSLQNAIALLSQLSAIKISLDHAALIRIGLSPETSIQYQGENNTIREALSQLLEPLGLVHIPSGESLFITVPDYSDQELFEESYAFDAYKPEFSAEAMEKIVRTVIAPDSWESAGGEAKISRQNNQLRITQTKAGHSATHRLLTQIQGMHDMPAKNPARSTHNQTTEDPLAQIILYGTRQPMPLAAFVRQLSSRIDQNIVLDELALLRSGISSEQLIEVEIKKRSLRDLVNGTLTPLGLVSQIMGDHTIIVTSDPIPESALIHRIYSIPPNIKLDDEKLIASICEQIAPNSWFSRGGAGRVVVEKNSRMLIILQEPGVHRKVVNYLNDFSVE